MGNVVGIDLGTTNSVVAFLENGKPQVMQNAEGQKTTPSAVLYRADGEIVVGDLAKRQRLLAPDRTILSIKRFVGCRWDESEDRRLHLDYTLVPNADGLVAVEIDGQQLLPEVIQAEVLRKMKQTAEDFLGEPVTQAVITCPAYFNDSQRQATKKAADLAGLQALRIINEPTAAALAYGLAKRENQRIAVFDFGGGTFDISILEIDNDVFEVKSTCGDTFLGGDAVDRVVMNWMVERMRADLGIDPAADAQVMSRIGEAAERVKCELSTLEKTSITLPFIAADATGPKHFNAELTRAEFESLCAGLFARLRPPCEQALADANLKPNEVETVILVGGSTRIPAVRRLVQEIFGREPDCSVNPDEAVARGAAIQAGIMSGDIDEILLLDVTPLSLGIELAGGVFAPLIPRNSAIPTTARKSFTTVRDNQQTVSVHVLQGERRIATENRTLSRFRLEGIAPAPREVPEIEVAFHIDANGILQVGATDLTTGAMQQVRIESYQPVASPDTDRLVHDAEAKADADKVFMQKLVIRRALDDMTQDLQQLQTRDDVRPLREEEERKLKEALFRMDIALAQDDWAIIDTAHRDLKGLYNQFMTLAGVNADGAQELVFETPKASDKEEETKKSAV